MWRDIDLERSNFKCLSVTVFGCAPIPHSFNIIRSQAVFGSQIYRVIFFLNAADFLICKGKDFFWLAISSAVVSHSSTGAYSLPFFHKCF